ncbi:thiosulfate sulfurtransferase [Paenibacillus baekrokdamisoli]|uniref:Thiosulfate sulfurtransferase n=1 Tax=Paenibacillus baekrokdamisoli TaxID=1712516 RepID=A0A3G9IXN8_9BACL|nr:sulfurtransferase [Paenibacillus baekrokdamisoli]MBB3073282.1 thiosulfate/3-mercaptopyruvate sulfurtransferase [Paenibacillus baekrokdamisoli]BBH23286.1 thiosulfate sulfurtransferase [Paenibacillus baekrokdamisoli]
MSINNLYVTPEWLVKYQNDGADSVRIVDCRFLLSDALAGEKAYADGHIEGAVYLDLERELSAPKREDRKGGRHPLPEPTALAAALGHAGISNGTHVVAYDEQGGAMAARLVWLLRWLGHDGGASILDGGFAAWQTAGYPVSNLQTEVASSEFVPHVNEELVVSADEVRSRLGTNGVVLIDSREAPRYRGEVEPIDPVAGHIPGAINHFWKDGLAPDGTWLSGEEQRARFDGISQDDEIIVYCGSGVTACPNVFALEAAGFKNVKLYAGSWSDWISYGGNPVATGEE